MRANTVILWLLAAYFFLAAGVYTFWSVAANGEVEWAGTVTIALSGILAAFIAFYLGMVHKNQGGELPEDREDAVIDDGDPELGYFSPWSWWPILFAAAAFQGIEDVGHGSGSGRGGRGVSARRPGAARPRR